jgi:poly(A) polymerase
MPAEGTLPLEDEPKAHTAAVVLIPPDEAWEPIQAIRRKHDPQIDRWMPHITLLYPFVPEACFGEAAERLRPAATTIKPFQVTLPQFDAFVHGRRSATLWLRPEPTEPVETLQAALQAAVPWCNDVSRYANGFTPHLSVGRFAGRRAVEAARWPLSAAWEPVSFWAREVCLIARNGREGDPFHVRMRLPLGG